MSVQSFLRGELKNLAEQFQNINVKYAFNEIAETHVVQLTPQNEYYNNIDLDKTWIGLSVKFMEKFPNENISFISDDSLLKITIPELEFNKKTPNEWFISYQKILTKIADTYLLDESNMEHLLNGFHFNNIHSGIKSHIIDHVLLQMNTSFIEDINFSFSRRICKTVEIDYSSIIIENDITDSDTCDSDNYTMAA